MESFILGLGLGLIIMAVLSVIYISQKISKNKQEKQEEMQISEKTVYPYKLTQSIFSQKEGYFYRDVLPIANKLGLTVFTKMRLADLLYIPEGTKDYMKWFNRIKAKHIDFIFVDREMTVNLLVEIDDPTHNRADRKERDLEVDEMFRQQGLEVLHLSAWGKQYGAEDLETIITKALNVQRSAPGNEL